ncbi:MULTISPECIES: glutathione-regulated potassium-efflux system protein KefB [unclassified Vibrio]|uniref:glutathione-regulated potassium-efflux system protein KefB n=1 Tax=unclassified Vibrio TaxID=2614977 RepID=UPI001483824E|nr:MULTISPECIES: glutathione-regulated potassium-efflux system protein KefB [unclassified Vibrio]NNN45670.1 glutathione-regulated potassium-efflux system protein KefB [Vibrio sp. 1-1(7)]NNN73499.1 glutathione-regulated potassium-efflux system protein KefB [Vibrio sp. 12-2(3-a)]
MTDWLSSSVIFLMAAVVAVPIAQRLGLGAILGYLLAGIVIGPWGLKLINDVNAILHFAEFGVVLLLFLVGLELNPKRLWRMKGPILGLGGSQMLVSSVILASGLWVYGFPWPVSLCIGLILAQSSTAIALRTIDEMRLTLSDTGRTVFAVSLFQDLAVIPTLALVTIFSGQQTGESLPLVWMLTGVIGLLIAGHFLLQPLFRWVVNSQVRELFTVASLLLVIAMALLMEKLGLSMALGAFLAGMLLAESEFRHELSTAIEPFKGLLLGLFFIAVGMSVNMTLLWQEWWLVGLLVTGLISIKMTIMYGLARMAKVRSKARSRSALILSQGGEIGFVILTSATEGALLTADQSALLILVISVSMMTTPLLLKLQTFYYHQTLNGPEEEPESTIDNQTPQVIVAGFGRFGQIVGRLMYANKIKITVLENDASQIKLLRKYGYKVFYGDATHLELLRSAGAEQAQAIVICTDDPDEVMRITQLCQQHFPQLSILARARSRVEAYQLLNQGIQGYSRETFLGALDLGRQVLIKLGMHPYQAKRAQAHFCRLDTVMLKELLPQHNNDKALTLRTKEARKELEEIFSREMANDRQTRDDWEKSRTKP